MRATVIGIKPACDINHPNRDYPDELSELKTEGVELHGEVDDAKKFMSDYGIMLVPLFSGSGVRLKIMEGLAMGKLIVSTSKGAEGIDVTDGKEILIADTAEEFSEKISLLLSNDELSISIHKNARKFAEENFDSGRGTNKLIGFYQIISSNN